MAKNYKVRHIFYFGGKRYDIRGDSEREVAAKWAAKLAKLEQGLVAESSSALVRDYAMHIYETYRKPKVKQITYDKYIRRLRSCVLSKIGDMKIKDVKRVHCQRLLNDLEGQSKYQIAQTKQMITFIFEQAVIDGLINKSPAIGLVMPSGEKSTHRSLTKEEQDVFLEVAFSNPRYIIFLLSYCCGCRPEEARNIKGADIMEIDGEHILHIPGTKSANADRLVPIPADLYELVKDWPEDKLLAPNQAGNHHNQDSYARVWNHLKRDMNIKMGCTLYRNKLIPPYPLAEDLKPYCLRHTYCTNLAKAGVPLTLAQRLMGHADVNLTANIYTHHDTEDILSAAKLLNGGNFGGNL